MDIYEATADFGEHDWIQLRMDQHKSKLTESAGTKEGTHAMSSSYTNESPSGRGSLFQSEVNSICHECCFGSSEAHGKERDIANSVDSGVFLDSKIENENQLQENVTMTNYAKHDCLNTSLKNTRISKRNECVLYIKKGDIFSALEEESNGWIGCLALRSAEVGFVPFSILKFVETRDSWLTREGLKSSEEIQIKALAQLRARASLCPKVVYGATIPEPDYSDTDDDGDGDDDDDDETQIKTSASSSMVARNNRVNASMKESSNLLQESNKVDSNRFDEQGLIKPKKLINPCIESSEKKSLHRELLFNQKLGTNILNQKSELQKALEKHKDKQVLKEQERKQQENLTPLQKAITERALKLEQKEHEEKEDAQKVPSSEFEKVHAKLTSKAE